MNYIEHDRRNYSARTLSEDELRLHYGTGILSVIYQDGSITLSNGIDIYSDACYFAVSKTILKEYKDALQGLQ